MKITIDTKEDSHEEIKKIIKMLSSLVGDMNSDMNIATNQPNIFEDSSPSLTPSSEDSVLGSIFDANLQKGKIKEEDSLKEDEELPQIIPY